MSDGTDDERMVLPKPGGLPIKRMGNFSFSSHFWNIE
jgi:hypothetical protein